MNGFECIVEANPIKAEILEGMHTDYFHEPKSTARNSVVWDTFNLIFNDSGEKKLGFYYCTTCSDIIYSSHAVLGSTAQLLRHGCVAKEVSSMAINQNEFERLKCAAAKMVCLDLRPLRAVECPGLLDLVMAGVNLGKRYPNMTIDDLKQILPTRNTVKTTITSEAQIAKESIKILFQKAIANGGLGCTLDLWTDSYKQRSYLAMTANMILVEEGRNVQKRIVFNMSTFQKIVKSKAVIRKKIIDVFADFGVSQEAIKNYVIFTTDR